MKKAVKVLMNKYLLTTVGFLIWTIYFDQNDWVSLQQKQKELDGLNSNIAYLNSEINKMNKERNDLLTNPARLEQYARENYRMKHDNEDVYVIDNVSENNLQAEQRQ